MLPHVTRSSPVPRSQGAATHRARAAACLALALCGAVLAGLGALAARRSSFAGSRMVCVPAARADAAPRVDGSFALGPLGFAPPGELAPAASMLDPAPERAPGFAADPRGRGVDGLDAALDVARAVGARVPHVLAYDRADDPTHADFEPEAALAARRGARRAGTCATRAGLTVLELWRLGHAARLAQIVYAGRRGHVVAEAWSARHGRWVAVDPSQGSYLTVDGRPAPITSRLAAADRYRWVRFAEVAPGFPPFHALGPLGRRARVARIVWPEPWLLARRGARPPTWLRSTFAAVRGNEADVCALLAGARAAIGVGMAAALVGLVGAALVLGRRARREDDALDPLADGEADGAGGLLRSPGARAIPAARRPGPSRPTTRPRTR